MDKGCKTKTIVIAFIDELVFPKTIEAINKIVDDRPVDIFVPEDIEETGVTTDEIEAFVYSSDPNIYINDSFNSENDGKYYCETVKDILFDLDKKKVMVIFTHRRYATLLAMFFVAVVPRATSFAYHQDGIWTIDVSTEKNEKGSESTDGKGKRVSEKEEERP